MNKTLMASLIGAVLATPMYAAEPGPAAAAKVKFCEKSWDESGVVSFTFGNGTVLAFDTNKVSAQTQLDLRCHGASQKIGDSFAGAKGNFAEGIASAQAVIDQLYADKWSADREGGAPRLGELAAAIARIKGVEVAVAMAAVEKATDDQRKTWRSNAKVKATIAAIRAEDAQKALEAAGEQSLDVDLA